MVENKNDNPSVFEQIEIINNKVEKLKSWLMDYIGAGNEMAMSGFKASLKAI